MLGLGLIALTGEDDGDSTFGDARISRAQLFDAKITASISLDNS